MRFHSLTVLTVACLTVLVAERVLWAQNPAVTTITVPDMHCMSCAQKMAGNLYKVAGVAKVQADVKTKVLFINPRAQENPSPRGMWEAIEQAGYQPSRLQGPYGTFTKKPQS